MANSRLEKVGTIFTRTTALLRTGAMKPEDKPIWYDIYKAFPPKLEPRFDRPTPLVPIQEIFYEEDKVRARFHKEIKQIQSITLSSARETETQLFIKTYNKLRGQGALSDDKIFETSLDVLQQQRSEKIESNNDVQSLSARFSNSMKQSDTESINIKDIFKE